MSSLYLVPGDRPATADRISDETLECAIRASKVAGYAVGRHVRIGQVGGHIVGYNIGGFGRYTGVAYPLLVSTEYGIVKCALDEVRLAA